MKTENFNKLPRAHKRVLIAKDVIKQLNTEKLIAHLGFYISNEIFELLDYNHEADVKKKYSKIKSCEVCALGACLLSATKFGNQLKLGDLKDVLLKENQNADKLLASIFSKNQMLMIETAFEGSNGLKYAHDVLGESLDKEQIIKCVNFRYSYVKDDNFISEENRKQLLIAIMQNIIKNKGTFKP